MAPPNYSKAFLRQRASWIRDELDPRIARDGPECMQPDDVLALNELFLGLQEAELAVSTLRYSRIHLAVLEVTGKATRWPKRLCEECDKIVDIWTRKYGNLSDIRPPLFKADGRLYGICTGRELTRHALIKHWQKKSPKYVSPGIGKQHGNLAFKRGDWWINGMFAFHAGIISLDCTDGGICADKKGAYAIVMRGTDEVSTETPDRFKYRCKSGDPGRFRMTAADFTSRYPIRVLRSHTLNSLWAPKSGLRYEGLYTVIGWAIKPTNPAENHGHGLLWEVELERDCRHEDEESKVAAMKHPLAEETDDYMEYKRVRKEMLRTVRDELVSAISPRDIPPTPPTPGAPEKPTITVQSPPMSPSTERPFDYGTIREPELPASGPESPPPLRTPFFHPPSPPRSPYFQSSPSPRSQAGPFAQPDRERPESPPQSGGLTVPPNIRQSISAINPTDARGNRNNSPDKTNKEAPSPRREYRGSIARSFSRILSDGAADVPESPFGSVYITDTNEDDNRASKAESSSYPFDTPPPLSALREQPTLAEPKPHPILRQPQWGTTTTTNNNNNNNISNDDDDALPLQITHLVRRRGARAVYEAFAHQNQGCPPDARLVLGALNDVWHDAAEPEYPDMVLEESAYERAGRQGYSFGGGLEKRGSYVGLSSVSGGGGGGGGGYYNNGGYYSVHATAGGGRTNSWSSAATSRVSPRGSRVGEELYRRKLSSSSAADVGMQVLLLQQQLQQRPRLQQQERGGGRAGRGHWVKRSWSSGDADTAAAAARDGAGACVDHPSAGAFPDSAVEWRRLSGGSGGGRVAARRRSASVVESRRSAGDGNRSRRPTIVRFSGMFKRQSLDDTVDEGVDEASAEEEERRWRKKGGGPVKAAEVLGQDFVVGADW